MWIWSSKSGYCWYTLINSSDDYFLRFSGKNWKRKFWKIAQLLNFWHIYLGYRAFDFWKVTENDYKLSYFINDRIQGNTIYVYIIGSLITERLRLVISWRPLSYKPSHEPTNITLTWSDEMKGEKIGKKRWKSWYSS